MNQPLNLYVNNYDNLNNDNLNNDNLNNDNFFK